MRYYIKQIFVNNNYMLDKRSKSALRYFVQECNEGGYKILEVDDILAALPKKYKADEEVVSQIVKYLENGEYISVKYADKQQYCICPLPFGRQFIENIDQTEKNNKKTLFGTIKNALILFISSFLGAFLGTFMFYVL